MNVSSHFQNLETQSVGRILNSFPDLCKFDETLSLRFGILLEYQLIIPLLAFYCPWCIGMWKNLPYGQSVQYIP